MLSLDHLVVSAVTLADGMAVDHTLGVPLQQGGEHVLMGTHNRLLGLGSSYLEVIAIDPERRFIDRARWFGLDHFAGAPRLTNWVCRTHDLAETVAHFPGSPEIVDFSRGPYRWRMALPRDGHQPYDGAFPIFIEWVEGDPASDLIERDCRLMRLEIAHPLGDELGDRLAPLLADPRIHFVTAPEKSLRAVIATPSGEKILS
jgi:Glyoxalase-like domain